MTKLLIEPHYLPSLEYFTLIQQVEEMVWDVNSPFQKQTFRNRCYVLSANGVHPLIVPVHFHTGTLFKDTKVDYNQSWVRQHKGAIYSSYGKSPFFDYFYDDYQRVWNDKPTFLLDLNQEMLSVCFRLLQRPVKISLALEKTTSIDLRDRISAKKSFETREFYKGEGYAQNFGNTFAPNLSIIDLLFCQGPESGEVIKRSIQVPLERFDN